MARYIALVDGKAGAYGVSFPDLPGCVAMGATVEKAMENAADAMRDWADTMEDMGKSIPMPRSLEEVREDEDVKETLAEGAFFVSLPLVRETGKPVKANLSLDAGILAAIDEEAKRRKLTRSDFIAWMARRQLAA